MVRPSAACDRVLPQLGPPRTAQSQHRLPLREMKIVSVEATPVRIPRDWDAARGTAGSPNTLSGQGDYRWSNDYPTLYPVHFETALVRVTLDNGLIGIGEAQAPLVPA